MDNIVYWLQSSLMRVFPNSPASNKKNICIHGAGNERISFQACLRNLTPVQINTRISVSGPKDLGIQVRRVGYVLVRHHNTDTNESELDGVGHIPGYVPDPLFPEETATLGPFESHAFWITVSIPPNLQPGIRTLNIQFIDGDTVECTLTANITVYPFTSQPSHNFPVTHWIYADAICDWYSAEPFDERFWAIAEQYLKNLVEHGNNCLYVPLFTPPTDGVKRPTQLLRVTTTGPDKYLFDFSDVQRWVQLAKKHGAKYFEWTHLFSQWGARYGIRIYRNNQDINSLIWPPETEANSETYRKFLAQFLPEFHRFLQSNRLVEQSFFHLSDEPGKDDLQNYKEARNILKELAPWMKIADALSDINYGREGLTDIPIPSIESARYYADAGIPAWTYFCCGPRGNYLNRLMDTSLAKIRMSGWLFYHLGAKGFLHWGYNYWYKRGANCLIDPFMEQSGQAWPEWPYGDTFVVYPGEHGPIDSIRWEIFAESLQDYSLLQTAGIARDDNLFSALKGYDDFPKTEEWLDAARSHVLSL